MAARTVLRALLGHARRTGWDHIIYSYLGTSQHVWRLGDRQVAWDGETLTIYRPGVDPSDWRPIDIGEVVGVLAVAGVVPVDLTHPHPHPAPSPNPVPWPGIEDRAMRREPVGAR
jgi:hypothetical protein